ncbi:MAG TPA: PQQ-dependent dehydrogenase, methanol/ethanol family, partial [Methylophilus sp.]|nr:PQQ-dependent dehydrogenase, methanol/ethanol family [Methylophilus sp.]
MQHKIKLAITAMMLASMGTSVWAETELDTLMKDDNQWAMARKDYANQGYSKLSQINKGNVKNVKLAWTFATGVNRGHEGAPLVIGNTMFIHTAFPNNVYA